VEEIWLEKGENYVKHKLHPVNENPVWTLRTAFHLQGENLLLFEEREMTIVLSA
jgi:hypothetical protein